MADLNATSTPGYGFSSEGAPAPATSSFIYHHLSPEAAAELIATANALVSPRGRGIYATDETPDGIDARLTAALGENGTGKVWTDEERRDRRKNWRECLYKSLPSDHISGVILFTETLHDFGLAPLLTARGIIPGIRADTDSHPLLFSPLEFGTQGLDDLLPRLQAAYAAGARFAKWRAPILCNASSLPTHGALKVQAEALGRFAAIAQQAGLVPIVEPDVDFSADASLARSVQVHERIITMIYSRCIAYGVLIEGTLIKPSFPQPGLKHPSHANTTPEDVALATSTVLARTLPVAVPGVVFLSGGLSDDDTTAYLGALNALASQALPQAAYARLPPLSFSFGRGLQGSAMRAWVQGDEEGACKAFADRAKACWVAAGGKGV